MEYNDLESVYLLADPSQAEIIKNYLEGERIRCFIDGEQAATATGMAAFQVHVMVRAADADRARRLIEEHERHK